MAAGDVQQTLDDALATTDLDHVRVRHRPRLLSDNGPGYISNELRDYLEEKDLTHTRGAPYHPQTQGKIERYHRTLKSIVKLRNYYLPWALEREIKAFVRYYNNERVYESLDNLAPADVYNGRAEQIKTARQQVKEQTLKRKKCYNMGRRYREQELIKPSLYRECVC